MESICKEYAPVLVTVYNRKKHFSDCIDSLKKNHLAKETILYIASDYSSRKEDEQAVFEIRELIKNIDGFKEVRPILRTKNLGSYDSVVSAITEVLERHKCMIVTEDDNVFSEYYLHYMNDGLDKYKDDTRIFSICGFSFDNLKIPHNYHSETYLWSRNNPWGYGTWRDRWQNLDLDLKVYPEFISNKTKVKEFYKIAPHELEILKADRRGDYQALDVRLSFNMFINNQYSVYPVKHLINNKGFDGQGEHCEINEKSAKKFGGKELTDARVAVDVNITPDKRIYRRRRMLNLSYIRYYIKIPLLQLKLVRKLNDYRKNLIKNKKQ